jgi:predicted RNase H-like nuclease
MSKYDARLARAEAMNRLDELKLELSELRKTIWRHGATADMREVLARIDRGYDALICAQVAMETEAAARASRTTTTTAPVMPASNGTTTT